MSHEEQRSYIQEVKHKYPAYFKKARVLEVGSFNVNGSVREFFEECDYTGIDLVEGPCVDVVCSGDEYKNPIPFDTVISCEMLEHNLKWVETLQNMHRLLRPGGLLIITCATKGRPEHGTNRTSPRDSPSSKVYGDYYHNLEEEDFLNALDFRGLYNPSDFSLHLTDIRFCGTKGGY